MKLATVIVLAQMQVYDCLPQYPGDDFAIGRQWSWQTVDGRKCWYPGPRRIPKDRLRWPEVVFPKASQPEPETPPKVFPKPSQAEPDDEFSLRWKGEPR